MRMVVKKLSGKHMDILLSILNCQGCYSEDRIADSITGLHEQRKTGHVHELCFELLHNLLTRHASLEEYLFGQSLCIPVIYQEAALDAVLTLEILLKMRRWGLRIFFLVKKKKFMFFVNPCSSQFPDPHIHDQVTSYVAVYPTNLIPSLQQGQASSNDLHIDIPAYHTATGCSDGTLKLWRSNSFGLSNPHFLWELVGIFVAHQGPLSVISLTDCG